MDRLQIPNIMNQREEIDRSLNSLIGKEVEISLRRNSYIKGKVLMFDGNRMVIDNGKLNFCFIGPQTYIILY